MGSSAWGFKAELLRSPYLNIYRYTSHYLSPLISINPQCPLIAHILIIYAISYQNLSDRENYFVHFVRQALSALPDILRHCQTFFPVDDWQIPVVILVFLVGHFMCIELWWTKCPARTELSAGHKQKSAGHVRHISRSLKSWLRYALRP